MTEAQLVTYVYNCICKYQQATHQHHRYLAQRNINMLNKQLREKYGKTYSSYSKEQIEALIAEHYILEE